MRDQERSTFRPSSGMALPDPVSSLVEVRGEVESAGYEGAQ
jgi:hypothetical protein